MIFPGLHLRRNRKHSILLRHAERALANLFPDVSEMLQPERIPRVIHQVWHDKNKLPPEFQQNIQAIKAINPLWQYRLYDLGDIESFIQERYGADVLAIYRLINPEYIAPRADFFRYLLIYAEGGVYLDMKSATRKSLDEVLKPDDRYILSHWDNGPQGSHPGWGLKHRELAFSPRGEYQQWFIAGVPGHPFLKAVIERVITNILHYNPLRDGIGHIGVLSTTGPIPYTVAIWNIRDAHPHRLADAQGDLGLTYSIYEGEHAVGHHRQLSRKHYTTLKSPVVMSGRFSDTVITLTSPLLKKLRLMKRRL